MKNISLVTVLPSFVVLACSGTAPPEHNDELLEMKAETEGCWKDIVLNNGTETINGINRLTLNANHDLVLTTRYELGPRCRIWLDTGDEFVFRDGFIQWGQSIGMLRPDRSIIDFVFRQGRDSARFRFERDDAACMMLSTLEASTGDTYEYTVPENTGDGWTTLSLAQVGMDPASIVELVNQIVQGAHGDIHNILLIKDNSLVLEAHFSATGQLFGPLITQHFRQRPHHLGSTTKGILSALIGIAIDRGMIERVDEPIFTYLPNYRSLESEQNSHIMIDHLLTMRAGLRWDQHTHPLHDARNDSGEMWRSDDAPGFVLVKPVVSTPGNVYNYSNGISVVLGEILKNAAGRDVDEFAREFLFEPLSITDYEWERIPEGTVATDGGLALRPRDLARIGQLYLNNGSWDNQPIISKRWIEESTAQRLSYGRPWGYGYQWMQRTVSVKDRQIDSFFVPGSGGEFLAVFPEIKMVIVFNAGNYESDPKSVYYNLIDRYLMPAVL